MPDYSNLPSNNNLTPKTVQTQSKPEEKYHKVEKMFDVKPKKEKSKFTQMFLSGSVEKAKDFLKNSALPAFKDVMWTNTIRAFETMVFGEPRYQGGGFRNDRTYAQSGYYDYSRPGQRVNNDRRQSTSLLRFDFSDIVFRTEDDAIRCLRKLEDLAAEQGDTAVAQLLDLVGRFPEPTDWNWVWDMEDLRRAYPKPIFGGDWIIVFPEPRAKRNN